MVNRNRPHLGGITAVFDLDGTIADTAGDLADAANAALISEGFAAVPAAAIAKSAGDGRRAMLQSALAAGGYSADAEQMLRMSERFMAHYEENIARKTQLFPGFADAAGLLRACGAKLVLCTNKRERLAAKLISALRIGGIFEAVAGGDTFAFHKPDPRHISELVLLAGGVLSAAVMVGDSQADAGAAKAAGVPFIAVSFGYALVPASELGADAVLNHFDELPALIGSLLPQMQPVQ
jgi:phosphoglycolate phosphatase